MLRWSLSRWMVVDGGGGGGCRAQDKKVDRQEGCSVQGREGQRETEVCVRALSSLKRGHFFELLCIFASHSRPTRERQARHSWSLESQVLLTTTQWSWVEAIPRVCGYWVDMGLKSSFGMLPVLFCPIIYYVVRWIMRNEGGFGEGVFTRGARAHAVDWS